MNGAGLRREDAAQVTLRRRIAALREEQGALRRAGAPPERSIH